MEFSLLEESGFENSLEVCKMTVLKNLLGAGSVDSNEM
jgi:hypothetical protein